MIEEYRETIGHNRGHPTGLGHEEKMDVISCLLDEVRGSMLMRNTLPGYLKTNAESGKW